MISYKDLGEHQPYAVADRFDLPASLFEAFKKLTCAGVISNRQLKSVVQEYQEAINAIDYALANLTKFTLQKHADHGDIADTMTAYMIVFNCYEYAPQYQAAKFILHFAVTGNVDFLTKAREQAEIALESVSVN